MSKRAEKAALIAYDDNWAHSWRMVYQEGYEQAEKDLIELAKLWVDSGEANIKSFKQFLKDRGYE